MFSKAPHAHLSVGALIPIKPLKTFEVHLFQISLN